MAKSKNHTAHNQSYKNHRNGIKRPKRKTVASKVGVDVKFIKNQKFALSGTIAARRKLADKAKAKK